MPISVILPPISVNITAKSKDSLGQDIFTFNPPWYQALIDLVALANDTASAPTGAAGGDLSGTYPDPVVTKINGVALGTTTATVGNFLIGSGSAWVSHGITGDIGISGAGLSTIATNAVTASKFRQSAANSLVGNSTGSAANTQDITLGSTLTFSGTSLRTIAFSGDVTTSANSFATTIANDAVTTAKILNSNVTTAKIADANVTYAKIQNVTNNRLLGNNAGSAGSIQEITLGTNLSLSGTTLNATTGGGGTVNTVVGTANRIAVDSTDAANPIVNISTNYVGQNTITTLGTVSTGTWNGTAIPYNYGGTTLTGYVQGDLLYASSTTALATLAKSTTATRYLSNTGSSNNPAWAAIDLTNGVTGTLPVANGGTGITSLGTGVATWLGTPSSASLLSAITDETGTGSLVFANTPTLVTPVLGAATATSINFGGTSLANYVVSTWTPTVTLVGGAGNTVPTFTLSSPTGYYTRIGNMCYCVVYMANSAGGTAGAGTGQVNLSLPITASAGNVGYLPTPCGSALNSATYSQIYYLVSSSATTIPLTKVASATSIVNLTGADFNNTTRYMQLRFWYEV